MAKRTAMQQILFFVRWKLYLIALALPAHAAFVWRGVGDPRCGVWRRFGLVSWAIWTHMRVECGHNPMEALHILHDIIALSPDLPGVIVECGAYCGGSTAKLSRAAALVGRKMIVCDSFDGLPAVGAEDRVEGKVDFHSGHYRGTLEQVRATVQRYGKIDCVTFVKGWYDETLFTLRGVPIACAFWDVDLQASFRTCIAALWADVQPGSKVFIHDLDRPPVVECFTDADWWQRKVGALPPRLVGAGTGLGEQSPLLGYAVKSGAVVDARPL